MLSRLLPLLLLVCLCTCAPAPYLVGVRAQIPISIESLETSAVAEDGLYFEGVRGVNYQYGKRITPHGDCIDVIGGYQFVTWYKGGMENRQLMLSRRRDEPGAEWVHLQFPHQHIGFQQNARIGDSHNVAVIGVSTADSTIHLIYDLHAYRASSHGDDHFSYSVSKPGTAFVDDEAFTMDIFRAKRPFLRPGVNYERLTYPSIRRAADGSLYARYRFGGSGNGDIIYALYQKGEWSEHQELSKGMIPLPERHNVYSIGESFFNGRLHACFQIRYTSSSEFTQTFNLNRGLYWAYAEAPYGANDWKTTNGQPLTIPFRHPDDIEIGTPSLTYGTADRPRSTIYPKYVETADGSMHAIVRVDNTNVHYWKPVGETEFRSAPGGQVLTPNGIMVTYNGYVIVADRSNGRLIMRAAPQGTNDWTTILQETDGPTYRHFNGVLRGDKLYIYLMETGQGEAQPLRMKVYQLSGGTTSVNEANAELTGLTVFPNPARGAFSLKNAPRTGEYRLLDTNGRTLRAGRLPTSRIEVAGLPSGLYYLEVKSRGAAKVLPVVVD